MRVARARSEDSHILNNQNIGSDQLPHMHQRCRLSPSLPASVPSFRGDSAWSLYWPAPHNASVHLDAALEPVQRPGVRGPSCHAAGAVRVCARDEE